MRFFYFLSYGDSGFVNSGFGNWKLEIGIWNWDLEFGIGIGIGIWNLEFGIWDLEFGIWNLEFNLDAGQRSEESLMFVTFLPILRLMY